MNAARIATSVLPKPTSPKPVSPSAEFPPDARQETEAERKQRKLERKKKKKEKKEKKVRIEFYEF